MSTYIQNIIPRIKEYSLSLIREKSLFTPPRIGDDYPCSPNALLSSNPICNDMSNLEDGSIRLQLKYESDTSVNIGSGMRARISITNEVSILCIGNAEIIKDSAVEKFAVCYNTNKNSRVVHFVHTDGTQYVLRCKQLRIENYDEYCESNDGTRKSVAQAITELQKKAPSLRNYLRELKAKRGAAKHSICNL